MQGDTRPPPDGRSFRRSDRRCVNVRLSTAMKRELYIAPAGLCSFSPGRLAAADAGADHASANTTSPSRDRNPRPPRLIDQYRRSADGGGLEGGGGPGADEVGSGAGNVRRETGKSVCR